LSTLDAGEQDGNQKYQLPFIGADLQQRSETIEHYSLFSSYLTFKNQPGSGGRVAPSESEERIETTTNQEMFVFRKLFGLDTAAEAVQRCSGLSKPAAYSTNGLPLKQSVRWPAYSH